jgi:hypothetical protein
MLRMLRFRVPRCAAAIAPNIRCPGGGGGGNRAAAACAALSHPQRRSTSDAARSGPLATTASAGATPDAAAASNAAAPGAAGTVADDMFQHDVLLNWWDLVPIQQWLTYRFPMNVPFTAYATRKRRELARDLLAKPRQLLTGPQGVGKSFFAALLVHELRRCEPNVPVMYLPNAWFDPEMAARALRFALEKAGCPPVPGLKGLVLDLNVVIAAMHTVTVDRKVPLRLVIDQMNIAFRTTPPNHNYAVLNRYASWSLLVMGFTTENVKLLHEIPTTDYGAEPFDEAIGCEMLRGALPEGLGASAPLLYKRTGGNPLELSVLAAHLRKRKCESKEQLEASVRLWFSKRVNSFHKKLTADGDEHTCKIIAGWMDADDCADPRFFADGVALFPAVEAAMLKVIETHSKCVPGDLEHRKHRESYGRVYESRVRRYLTHKDLFGLHGSAPTMKAFVCNTVPEDFAATIASVPETSQLVIWWPDEDKVFNQRYFDFVYALYVSNGKGGGTWYVAFVQCCGDRHPDTLSSFLGSSLWEEWRTALNGLRTVEYVWLSHTQPAAPTKPPRIFAPGRGNIEVFPPAKSEFFEVERKAVPQSNSVLASEDTANAYGRWVYASKDSSFPIPTVSLKLLSMATVEKPPTPGEVYVRVHNVPGLQTAAVVNVASTLGGLRHDVDGLKHAVMKELANSLVGTGIGITRLVVYPPGPEMGTEPYAAMSTTVAAAPEGAPYHVVLPDQSAVKATAALPDEVYVRVPLA